MEACQDIPDFSLCQKYVSTSKDVSETEFLKQVEDIVKNMLDEKMSNEVITRIVKLSEKEFSEMLEEIEKEREE